MVPEVLVYIIARNGQGGQTRVLIDDACGITYQENAGRMPVYGYKDVYFQKAALGKSLATGILMVNKSFKNAIGVITAYFLNQSKIPKQKTQVDDIDNKKNDLNTIKKDIELLSELLELFRTNSLSIKQDAPGTTPEIDYLIGSGSSYLDTTNDIQEFIETNTALLTKYNCLSLAENGLSTLLNTSFFEYDALYTKIIVEADYTEFNGNNTLGQRKLLDTYNANKTKYNVGDQSTEAPSGIPAVISQLSEIVQTAVTSLAQGNRDINSLLLSGQKLSKYESILSESLFKDINNAGLIIDLQVEYGKEGDEGSFTETLEDCWFTSKAMNATVDNRDIMKDMYQFFAKKIT